MDVTMWQSNERKARFIAAALSGDRSIRTLEDAGSQANQFALAKAIASGDGRLILIEESREVPKPFLPSDLLDKVRQMLH